MISIQCAQKARRRNVGEKFTHGKHEFVVTQKNTRGDVWFDVLKGEIKAEGNLFSHPAVDFSITTTPAFAISGNSIYYPI